ncbi:NAD(P)/FAD-dependent oxidoreductase [Filimonas effusa]|uniref:FAD-binding oxidoreductase n=1 Tax=Filimonas effusa TaxID=2508721 RepID=A0A4Q1D3U1_9BACT|nr:FAD-binding oxidoreductase [Filimonas effusa]RXK82998.1 FAD-binding oxidoreductase [Filimonas effusa]
MEVDYIIIGQGICGSFLSWELSKEGQKLLIIDEPRPFSSTKVASGVINPVTGRQVVTTWLAEELIPFTWDSYSQLGEHIGEQLVEPCSIYAFPPSEQMREAYNKKMEEGPGFVKPLPIETTELYHQYFNFRNGAVEITPVWLIHLHKLLKGWRQQLATYHTLWEEKFDNTQLQIQPSHVSYKGIKAKKVFFCNGIDTFEHPLWSKLPYSYNKGEALIADIPGLPFKHIYKFGITTLVPWYNNLWWVGSSYDNHFTDDQPSETFRNRKMAELELLLKCDYSVIDHIASIRPATIERRPFAGFHPLHPTAGIFNGMGTKGCSLAPYLAKQLARETLYNEPVIASASVQRFSGILK